ncbi:MAG: hypothetical protein KGZ54_11445 [Dethiobacter sp.]|jgi:glutamate synthase domain-containing protein 3|nr:hypothetical protein [Dethiobacter sp.]MBS3902613.1 hypothetical protein [Dethiobacter sp.]MBS3988729.1 hypothetical protein [Dethiobacter sp.]
MFTINARGVYYKELNQMVRQALSDGAGEILIKNVNGQCYIADALRGSVRFTLEGTPGNNLAAYMDGPEVIIRGNAQDAVANTMNSGTIVIHGDAGDTLGYAMRGGEIFVRGNAGYRAGIHLKEYGSKIPLIVVGGKTGDFLGEYMAGGIIAVLGEPDGLNSVGRWCGTGMHGGVMYIRGEVPDYHLGNEVRICKPDAGDEAILSGILSRFRRHFKLSVATYDLQSFIKLVPKSNRPYGNVYVDF